MDTAQGKKPKHPSLSPSSLRNILLAPPNKSPVGRTINIPVDFFNLIWKSHNQKLAQQIIYQNFRKKVAF